MSNPDERSKDKVSADAFFLECHKLLKSMEDSTTQPTVISAEQTTPNTPNGHLSPAKDGVDQDSDSSNSSSLPSKPVNKELVNSKVVSNPTASQDHVPAESEKSTDPAPKLDHYDNADTNGFASANHDPPKLTLEHKAKQNGDTKDPSEPQSLCPNGSSDHSTNSINPEDEDKQNVKYNDREKPSVNQEPPILESNEQLRGDKDVADTCKTTDNAEQVEVEEGVKTTPPTLKPMTEVKETAKSPSELTPSDSIHSAPPSTTAVNTVPQVSPTATSSGVKSAPASVQSAPAKLIAPKPVEVTVLQPQVHVPVTSRPTTTYQPVATSAAPVRPGVQGPPITDNKGKGRGKKTTKQLAAPPVKLPKELGPTASFLCELGMDLVKEGVYKDLISIQSKKQKADKLNESEIKQLGKLKDNYDAVSQKNKEVKVSYNLKCDRCKFVTESKNVMWLHHEYPHTDERENLFCSHCTFATRIPVVFTFHMESEHQMRGRITPKPAFWNCSLCQFETNTKGVLTKHRWKCEKGFNYKLNLCPTSSHVNYCLAYNFYKQPKPTPPPEPPKPVVRPPAARLPVQPVIRGRSFAPRGRFPTPIRQQLPQQPVRMIPVLQNVQQSVIVQRPMAPQQYQFVPRQSTTPSLTVKQMLNNQSTMGQPQTQLQNYSRPVIRAAPPPRPDLGLVSCEICKGYVKDKDALRVHFFFAHQIDLSASLLKRAQPPLSCDVCHERFWTSQGLQKHKETLKHYKQITKPLPIGQVKQQLGLHICIICGVRVTLLLDHMNSVHNLSLRDFLIAKRCIVCGGSFQNRPSLEIHLASSHGILVKTASSSSGTFHPATPAQQTPAIPPAVVVNASSNRIMPVTALRTTGASACIICNISFLNNDLLTKHCQHCHASCVGCGMIFADVAARNRHKCSGKNTNLNLILACLVCKSRVHSRNMRTHVLKYHIKKCSVSLKRKSALEAMGRELSKKPRLLEQSEPVVLDGDQAAQKVNNSKDKNQTQVSAKTAEPVKSDTQASEPCNSDKIAPVKEEDNSMLNNNTVELEDKKNEPQNVSKDISDQPDASKSAVPKHIQCPSDTDKAAEQPTSDATCTKTLEQGASTGSDKAPEQQNATETVKPAEKDEPMDYEETLCRIQPLNA